MSESTRQKLLSALKRHQPASLRATLTDDTVKDIAVSKGRVRWAPSIEVLADLAWSRVEMLDAKGKLLGVIDNDAPATDLEVIGGASATTTRTAEVASLLGLMLRAQDMALQRHTEALKPTLEALRTTVKDLTDQAMMWRREANKSGERVDVLADKVARMVQAKEDGDEKGWVDAVADVARAMPAVMQMAGTLAKMLPGGGGAATAARPSVPRPPPAAPLEVPLRPLGG